MTKREYQKKCNALFGQANELGVTLQFNPKDFDYRRLSCLWYGGTIACIRVSPQVLIEISAIGIVDATLYDKKKQVLVRSKDKAQHGVFYNRMYSYIKNDKQLKKFERNGRLVLDDNNWLQYDGIVFEDGKNASRLVDLYETTDNLLDNDVLVAVSQVLGDLDKITEEILSQKEVA